jgi:hypothetical protein
MAIGGPDKFDCFRRAYIAGMLADAADAMPARKRREFRKFLRSLPTGSVFDAAKKRPPSGSLGERAASDEGLGTHNPGTPYQRSHLRSL